MRALRDFNLPKIVSDDNPVFLGLISDLFPSLDVPRDRFYENPFWPEVFIFALQKKN
jgi:dynein heavy chain